MARFLETLATGSAAIQAATERKRSSKFTPSIRWKDKDKKYILFLNPIDEIPTVLYHNMMTVGFHEVTNKAIYESFISRRDPHIDGQDGYDELVTRFGEVPKARCIALAVELSPIFEKKNGRNVPVDWDIETRQYENKEGETVEVPAVGLIIESPHTFFGYLSTFADDKPIESEVFAVTRRGAKTDTAYDFVPMGDAPEIGNALEEFFAEFDFDAYLEDLASEERMKEIIGPLPDDFVVNPYSKKGKGKAAPARGASSRFKPNEEEEQGEAESSTDDDASTPTSRRFRDLEKKFGKKDEE